MESTINRGRAYECLYCFYKGELKKLKEHVDLAHVALENHQFHCLLCRYVARNERELNRHSTFYLKHRQERENKLTAGTFIKNEDYLVIKQDPAYCWKFIGSRDCRRMSQAESQVLWASRQKFIPVISGSTTTVSTPLLSSTAVIIATPSPSSTVLNTSTESPKRLMPYSPEIPELTDTDLRHCLGSPVEMPLPLRSPPCTVERPSLPDITLPPPIESDENIMNQILPDSSRADNNFALEELTQAVLAGNALQRQMLEILGKMLTELRRTTDQLEKVEVAIRRQRAPRPPAPTWNRPRFQRQPQRFRSPTPEHIKVRSVIRHRSESPPHKKSKRT